jgi:hypothetical protein
MSSQIDIPVQNIPTEISNTPPKEAAKTIFTEIKKYFIVVAILFIAAAISGYFYAKSQKPNYKSALTFALDAGSDGGDGSSVAGLANQLGFSVGGSGNVFSDENITGIMMSRRMIEKVLSSGGVVNHVDAPMAEHFLNYSELRNELPANSKLKTVHFKMGDSLQNHSIEQKKLLFMIYQSFYKNIISVSKPEKRSNIYKVEVTSPNEEFTKVFTDKLVKETDLYYSEICTKKAKDIIDILEKRVDNMRSNLGSSLVEKAVIQDQDINVAMYKALVPVEQKQFNIETYSMSYQELYKNLEIARFQYLKKIPLMQIIDKAEYPMIEDRLSGVLSAAIFAFAATILILVILILKIELTKNKH